MIVGFHARNIPLDQYNKISKRKNKSNSESGVEDSKAISDKQNQNQVTVQNTLKEGQIINPMDIEN